MAKRSPLAVVKETFGDKAKLVEAVQQFTSEALWVARVNKNKGLAHVSNAKLLRLHATFAEVKEKFGSREKLIDAIVELLKRSKDAGLRQKLSAWPVPRLYDTYRSTAKRLAAVASPGTAPKPRTKGPVPTAAKTAKTAAAKKTATKPGPKGATKQSKKATKKAG